MNALKEWIANEEKRRLASAALGAAALLLSFAGGDGSFAGLPDPAWIAIVLCGFPILKGALIGLVTSFDVKADVLVAIALVASVLIGEIFAAGEVAFIMSLGSLLEERTVRKAREGIEELVNMTPRRARVLRGGAELSVPAEEVAAGEILRVLPGESIAVDGVIVFGQTAVDQSLMTGEPMPVDKGVNDEVFGGTVNQFGTFDMRATRVGGDSSLQRMIRLVESADAAKTPIVRIMDRWASLIVGLALATAVGTWLVTGEIIRAVTILVVFCPCALVLATPTAIMAGIGRATRYGVLITSGEALERLAKVTRVVFDKTGTLTHGKPEVAAVESFEPSVSAAELLEMAATVEQRSEHPLGRAVLHHAAKLGVKPRDLENFSMLPGRGVSVVSRGETLLGGSLKLMLEAGVLKDDWQEGGRDFALREAILRHTEKGAAVICVSRDKRLVGMVALADSLRKDAARTVQSLRAEGVKVSLLTGDHAKAALGIAANAGIDEVRAELLPEDKARIISQEYQKDGAEKVCMIGDGINDAPALKTAFVGLAMGGVGSDIAVDAADGVLARDDIARLPHLLRLAKKTAATIRANIAMSMVLNFVTVGLAASGLMGPVPGALAHNAGALLIVLNSARLLGIKDSGPENAAAPEGRAEPEPA